MTDMNDVRKTLWNAYKKLQQSENGLEGSKSSEGYCELLYPSFWDCDSLEEFQEPCGLMIYSYVLGPGRQHFIYKSKSEHQDDYRTWVAPDIYEKAVEVIKSWEIDDRLF